MSFCAEPADWEHVGATFFPNCKNPLGNIGSETNSPGKPRSRVCEVALGAPEKDTAKQRGSEAERQTDRETERQRDKQTDRQTDRQTARNICNQFHLSAVSVPIWVCDGQYEPVKRPSNLSVLSVFQQILTRKYYNLSDEQTVQSEELVVEIQLVCVD